MRLVARLSGAASVSLYVPPPAAGARTILIHDGKLGPLPELANEQAAAEFHRRAAADVAGHDGTGCVASGTTGGILYRIPLRTASPRPEEEAGGPERRK